MEGKTAYFVDGTTKDVDAIILCTGYQHYFPFCRKTCASRRPTACGRQTSTRAWSGRTIRKFFYIGMQDQFYTFNMFDAQAWYVRDIILGRIKLPKAEEMKKDWKKWLKREKKLADAEQMI